MLVLAYNAQTFVTISLQYLDAVPAEALYDFPHFPPFSPFSPIFPCSVFSVINLSLCCGMRASRPKLLVNQCFRGLSLRSFWNSATVDQNSSYCVDLVRQHDYESYLMGLLIPRPHRRSFFAIRAFNIEIAMVKDQVPNNAQHAGRLRFQYWRDALQQIEQQAQLPKYNNQPVALELCRAITKYNLPIRWFERAIESR